MSAAVATTPRSAVEVWQDVLAAKFVRFRHVLCAGAAPHSQRAMSLYGPGPGSRVLDVGCGFGDTALSLSKRVGPQGEVVGIDPVDDFLAFAELHAHKRLRFQAADACVFESEEPFDLVFSRFGTMFFERPLAAFRNLHACLKPSGRLLLTTWRPIEDNPWLHVAKQVALGVIPPAGPAQETCGPGPFSQASQKLVTELLERAGFRDITFDRSDGMTLVGRTMDEALDFALAIGPAGEILREAGAAGAHKEAELRAALAEALKPYQGDGGICLPSAAHIIHARA